MFYKRTIGFSLIEMIVVISLSTILMAALSSSIVSFYQTNAYTIAQSGEIDSARRGIEVWKKDVREMDFGANGAYPIVTAGTSTLAFYADIDPDNVTEYIVYRLQGTTLFRDVYNAVGFPPTYPLTSPSTFTLSQFVQNHLNNIATFSYFDNNGVVISNPTANITRIRYVKMNVIVNIDPLRNPGEFMLETGVAPRNLKDNL